MESRLGYVKKRLQLKLMGASAKPATAVEVHWQESVQLSGVRQDPVSQAWVGPDGEPYQQEVSGVIPAFWHEVQATVRLRQFQQIQTGDVILDIDPAALVTVYPGAQLADGRVLSGVVALDSLAHKGVRFYRSGKAYVQKDTGEDLTEAWSVVVGQTELLRTLLLRKAT